MIVEKIKMDTFNVLKNILSYFLIADNSRGVED